MFLSWFTVVAQLGLQVDSGQAVLFGSDTIGSGKKLMWLPSKAALRAGYLNKFNSQNWDHDSIGKYSVAFGSNSQALGNNSLAMGTACYASGFGSIAIGWQNRATNLRSTVLGGEYNNATGFYSNAIGTQLNADSYMSTAIGFRNVGGGDGGSWVSSDPIFEVGIGWGGAKNAMTVYKNGKVEVGTPGQNNVLLNLNSERPWQFVQYSTGSTTALKLRSQPGNNSKNFIIDTGGRVGISDNSPSYKLELPNQADISDGQARAYDWDTYSDARVKREIQVIPYGIDEVMQLSPTMYHHHSSEFEDSVLVVSEDYQKEIGFIAQEVFQVIPEIVDQPKDDSIDLWSMSYARLVAVLTKAVQEQQSQIEAMQQRYQQQLDFLRKEINAMKKQREGTWSRILDE